MSENSEFEGSDPGGRFLGVFDIKMDHAEQSGNAGDFEDARLVSDSVGADSEIEGQMLSAFNQGDCSHEMTRRCKVGSAYFGRKDLAGDNEFEGTRETRRGLDNERIPR